MALAVLGLSGGFGGSVRTRNGFTVPNIKSALECVIFLTIIYTTVGDVLVTDSPNLDPPKRNTPSSPNSLHDRPTKRMAKRVQSATTRGKRTRGTKGDGKSIPAVKHTPGTVGSEHRRLACPYYKYNPIKHFRCLVGYDLRETCHVVQHLLRCHDKPIHCRTCGQTFSKEDECNAHIEARSCEQTEFHHPGMDDDQRKNIRDSQRRRGLNEVGRWFDLWGILFPDTPRPDSPYVGSHFEVVDKIYNNAIIMFADRLFTPPAQLDQVAPQPSDSRSMARRIVEQRPSWSCVFRILRDHDDLSSLASGGPSPGDPQHSGPAEPPMQLQQPFQPQNSDQGQVFGFWDRSLQGIAPMGSVQDGFQRFNNYQGLNGGYLGLNGYQGLNTVQGLNSFQGLNAAQGLNTSQGFNTSQELDTAQGLNSWGPNYFLSMDHRQQPFRHGPPASLMRGMMNSAVTGYVAPSLIDPDLLPISDAAMTPSSQRSASSRAIIPTLSHLGSGSAATQETDLTSMSGPLPHVGFSCEADQELEDAEPKTHPDPF